ncbi:hypothetical protein GBF38_014786 [Nibea albiflora]|uniref:Uncharacterized protein n=1 Tax=Nibea albiflora TaxID=240163 RepID=A0ACB7EK21_NIBAL|nr:hypothetical protein GBF38_014786 [Nibea albiflora]
MSGCHTHTPHSTTRSSSGKQEASRPETADRTLNQGTKQQKQQSSSSSLVPSLLKRERVKKIHSPHLRLFISWTTHKVNASHPVVCLFVMLFIHSTVMVSPNVMQSRY